jgi:hypothetical protein
MLSYAERECFDGFAQSIWEDAVDLVKRVDNGHGNEVRCHELARAALKALTELNQSKLQRNGASLELVDGRLWLIEHSWIVFSGRYAAALARHESSRRYILDVYCPGRLPQVQLLDDHFAVARGYEASPAACVDVNLGLVARLVEEMQR